MMPSSSANVETPPTTSVQLIEGLLAGEVPAGVHPGALSSNARAGARDTNTASAGDSNGAAGDTNGAAGDTNGAACALCELLAVKLRTGGGPCWPPTKCRRVQGTSAAPCKNM